MKFSILTLLILLALTGWILVSSQMDEMYGPNYEKLNTEVVNRLLEASELQTESWTLEDLAAHMRQEHEIDTSYGDISPDTLLKDTDSEGFLKDLIESVLSSENLSFEIRDGILVFVTRS